MTLRASQLSQEETDALNYCRERNARFQLKFPSQLRSPGVPMVSPGLYIYAISTSPPPKKRAFSPGS